jgi:two-component system sensor histidine kinase ChvG
MAWATGGTRHSESGKVTVGKLRVPVHILMLLPAASLLLVPLLTWWGLGALKARAEALHQTHLYAVARSLAIIIEESPLLIEQLAFTSSGLPEKDLAVARQTREVMLDGSGDEWTIPKMTLDASDLLEANEPYRPESFSVSIRASADHDYLYLLYEIIDDVVVYRRPGEPSVHRNDHIRLALLTPEGVFSRYTIANLQPGQISAHMIAAAGMSLRPAPEIKGQWLATPRGYQVELALPRTLIGRHFSTSVADVDAEDRRQIAYVMGRNPTERENELGRIVFPSDSIADLIATLPFSAVTVSDGFGRILAHSAREPTQAAGDWFDPVTVSANVTVAYHGRPVGFILIDDQTTDIADVARETMQSLVVPGAGLIALVLSLSALAYLILIRRFDSMRLRLGSGREPPAYWPRDRLDQLEQQYHDALGRIRQYNAYLEAMASRLSHELRTPVSVVRSSLENLRNEAPTDSQGIYIDRAQDGLQRLSSILNKMSEARRIEESLDEDEVTTFNLEQVVSGCVEGYKAAYPGHHFDSAIDASNVTITGIPDLVAQLLDKVIDNAVAFDDGRRPIAVRLSKAANEAILQVSNSGPCLPAHMQERLMDSMVSIRPNHGQDHHLGLGLYIARVIVQFHGGTITLQNTDAGDGVITEVRVPLLRITAKLR